jgi:hypothetical protein
VSVPYKDREKRNAYQNAWMQRRRNAWIAEHGPCIDCRSWDELQVDHVDASTKITHRIWSWSRVRREAELAKCVVRCKPCHEQKTVRNRERASQKPGENHTQAKLTRQQADDIRTSVLTNAQLARLYRVHPSHISRIRRGERRSFEVLTSDTMPA